MSSNLQIPKGCQHCGNSFVARTTVTKYCGDTCAKRAYKKRKRNEKIKAALVVTQNEIQGLQTSQSVQTSTLKNY